MVTIMLDINTLINELPEMLSGTKLKEAMQFLPEYDASIIQENDAKRLMKLSDLYTIYVPSQMSAEIYSKLYLGILRSLQKKGTRTAIRQFNQNNKDLKESCKTRLTQQYTGIIGGSDSFTIIGSSGIGKSSAISRAIHLITQNKVIQLDEPYLNILPCVCVQCPFDSSVKGLLLEILRKVDEELDTTYYRNAVRAKATTDMLIGSVSQVCLNHVGLLVVDEIQNVVNSKNGKQLIGSLTQLINNSGISICGTMSRKRTHKIDKWKKIEISEKHRRSIGEVSGIEQQIELNDTQKKIIKLLLEDNQLSAIKLADRIGIASRNIESNIKKLKELGILIRHGSPKNGYWEVTLTY